MSAAHQRAYDKIREAILNGDFGPGDHLREEELTQLCETSRTPVRQAMRSLEREGIIMFRSNRRSYVSDVSEKEAEEAFDILGFLESYSAGLAASRIEQTEIDNLKRIQDRFEAHIPLHEIDQTPILNVNAELHSSLHKASGNSILNDMIAKASGLTTNLYLKYGITGDPERACDEHWAIIKSLETRDAEAAGLHMKMHIESVRRVYRRHWNTSIAAARTSSALRVNEKNKT